MLMYTFIIHFKKHKYQTGLIKCEQFKTLLGTGLKFIKRRHKLPDTQICQTDIISKHRMFDTCIFSFGCYRSKIKI